MELMHHFFGTPCINIVSQLLMCLIKFKVGLLVLGTLAGRGSHAETLEKLSRHETHGYGETLGRRRHNHHTQEEKHKTIFNQNKTRLKLGLHLHQRMNEFNKGKASINKPKMAYSSDLLKMAIMDYQG